MNYNKIYKDFIADRRTKEADLIASGEYFEKHHIVPKSFGGGNGSDNLIALSLGDHYFAHELLARFLGGRMWQALFFMASVGISSEDETRVTYRTFSIARKNYLENLPDHITDIGNRLRYNESRKAAHKKWVDSTDISGRMKTRYKDPVYYQKWVDAQKSAWNDERRDKHRKIMESQWKNPAYIEKMKNRPKSPGAFTSEILKERWKDPSYIQKMKGRPKTNGGTFKKGDFSKRVINTVTGDVFGSATSASEKLGLNRCAVSNAIRNGVKAGGYRWAYA